MPTLRTTALIDAPAGTVAGAVIELALHRARLVSISDVGMSAVLTSQAFRAARLTTQCALTGAGTLLTCSLDWESPSVFLVRRPALALLTAVTDGARVRAESLLSAPVVVGTAIIRDGRVLAQQRAFPASVAGLWELPGGRVEPGENDQFAVRRECVEELGVEVEPGAQVGPDVILPSGKLLRIYRATIAADVEPIAREHKAVRWLRPDELDDLDWLPADRILLPTLFPS